MLMPNRNQLFELSNQVDDFSMKNTWPKGCVRYISACLKGSTCERRRIFFFFISKSLFVLDIIKFQLFIYANIMTNQIPNQMPNHETQNT